jgi:outer membrane receptor protein involved in Fe transport
VLWNITTKLSWQVAKSAQLSYFIDRQYKLIGHRGGGTFADSRARNYNYKYPTVNQVKYTMPIRSSLALDVTYSDFRSDDTFVPRPEVHPGDVATFDTTTQVSNIALPTYSDNWMSRDQVRASVSWSRSRHDTKFGFEFIRNDRKNRTWSLSGMLAQFANGVPASVNTYLVPLTKESTLDIPSDIPVLFQYRADETGAFIQDRWTVHRKLTLNAGLRYGTNRSWQPPSCAPETQFYPGQCFDKVTAPSFGDFSPRFNMVYDLQGDGRTALKFSANRYSLPLSAASSSVSIRSPRPTTPANGCRRAAATTPECSGAIETGTWFHRSVSWARRPATSSRASTPSTRTISCVPWPTTTPSKSSANCRKVSWSPSATE